MPGHAAAVASAVAQATGSTAAATAALDAAGALRPLGGLLVWRWPELDRLAPEERRRYEEMMRGARQGTAAGVAPGPDPSHNGLLRGYVPLAHGVTQLAYASARQLVCVGLRNGVIQCYLLSARGTLHYRYALDAHSAPVGSLIVRAHPGRTAAAADAAADAAAAAAARRIEKLAGA